MSELSASPSKLPPEQEAIRAKCFHPTGTFVEFPKEEVEQSIPVRFEKIVARCSDRVAVKDKSQQLTYELLNKTANRMARSLLAQRGKGEEPIAVLFEQGPLGIAAVLGVLKAGKMVVPLDPCYPRASIRYTIEDSQAALIVTNSQNFSLASDLAKNAARILNVDDIDSNFSTEDLETAISPDALAYILYTSGSTGQPKGLVQKHRNVLHQIRNNTNTLHICADDRLTLFTSVTGQAINTMLVALLNGASVCSFNIKEEGPTYLPAWLRQQEITVYSSVATVYRSFVAGLLAGSQFPSLRIIYLGGEPVYKADIELYKNFSPPGCVYISRFGISEAGSVSYYFINKKTIIAGDSVPVGYAAEDMQLLLLDDDGQELGGNRTGQIAVKSRFLSPGYWRRPEATRAAFLNDPRGGDDRVYLTGDLGRMLPDGCLIHCGRKDFRVKVRGYGVEPAEIERALLGIDTVKEAVVVGQDFIPGEQRLVAYLVAKRDTAPTISTVRRALAQKLPSYKIPSAFIMVEALPRTPNGKIDRQALPTADTSRPNLDAPYVAPRTPLEAKLVSIWAEVLSLDQVGIHDDFFDLGGHSLAVMRVASRVIEQGQVKIPLQALFRSPTVAEMAKVITECQGRRLGETELERVLTELESLSEEEAQRLLAEVGGMEQVRD